MSCVCVCVCVHQVHRSGDGSGEETVEVTGSETARLKAQELIEEIINSPASRGTTRAVGLRKCTDQYTCRSLSKI